MKIQLTTILFFLIIFNVQAQLYTMGGGVTDIDGNNYPTIIINGQEWMQENLKTTKFSNGELIPNASECANWLLWDIAWASYDNNIQNENIYGNLYNWVTVSDSRGLCPSGWHVPSDDEWFNLISYLDPNAVGGNNGYNFAGGKMKATGIQYWQSPNFSATNECGFSGLPGGKRSVSCYFVQKNLTGYWWSSTADNVDFKIYYSLSYGNDELNRSADLFGEGLSVRCLRNSTSGINEIKPFSKTLIKVCDIMGRETSVQTNQVLFYYYNDGSIEKKFVLE